MLGIQNESEWTRLLRQARRERGIWPDPRFRNRVLRDGNRKELLRRLIRQVFSKLTGHRGCHEAGRGGDCEC